jgi:hypothetical protein
LTDTGESGASCISIRRRFCKKKKQARRVSIIFLTQQKGTKKPGWSPMDAISGVYFSSNGCNNF